MLLILRTARLASPPSLSTIRHLINQGIMHYAHDEGKIGCDPWAGGRPLYLYLYLNLYLYLEWMYSEEEAVECMKVKRVATPGPWGPTGPSGHIVHLQAEPRYATTSAPVSR